MDIPILLPAQKNNPTNYQYIYIYVYVYIYIYMYMYTYMCLFILVVVFYSSFFGGILLYNLLHFSDPLCARLG